MTQRELAAQLGIKASHIAYLETGERRPSMALLQKLSRVFDECFYPRHAGVP